MWFIVVIDNDKFGKEYFECDSLSEAEELARDKVKQYYKLFGVASYTQILLVTDCY